MRTDQEYVIDTMAELETIFFQKQKEYKGEHPDVFRNFNQGAVLQHETPEQTLLGYVNKQMVSLMDAKHVNPERLSDPEFVIEKAKDIAVYMVILMAMVRSKHDRAKDKLSRQLDKTDDRGGWDSEGRYV